MNKVFISAILPLILAATPFASNASVTSGGVAAVGTRNSAKDAHLRTTNSASDCAMCHAEIFPFKRPDSCLMSKGHDCWTVKDLNGEIEVLTRTGDREIKRVYRYRPNYLKRVDHFQYFLPASEGVPNPHNVLER